MTNLDETIVLDAIQKLKSKNKRTQQIAIDRLIKAAEDKSKNEHVWLLLSAISSNNRKKLIRDAERVNPKSTLVQQALNMSHDKEYFSYIIAVIEQKVRGVSMDKDKTVSQSTGITKENSGLLGLLGQILVFIGIISTFCLAITSVLSEEPSNSQSITQISQEQQQYISLFTWSQISILLIGLFGLILLIPASRERTINDTKKIFKSIKIKNFLWFVLPLPLSLLGILIGFTVFLLTDNLITSAFCWLVAWLLLKVMFYTQTTTGQVSRKRVIKFLVFLIAWYFLAFIAFVIATVYDGSWGGTLALYSILTLFYLGSIIGDPDIKGRLADDLFIVIIIFTAFKFLSSFYSPEATAAATLSGTALMSIFGTRFDQDLIVPILNGVVIEYYFVSIVFLILLSSLGDNTSSERRVPASLIYFTLNAVGAILVGYAVGQTFTIFYIYDQNALQIISAIINLLVAMIGVMVLILTGGWLYGGTIEDIDTFIVNVSADADAFSNDALIGAKELEREITIEASPEKVMNTLRQIQEAAEWTPGLVRIGQDSPEYLKENDNYAWEYNLLNTKLNGRTWITVIDSNRLFEMRTKGFITGGLGSLVNLLSSKPEPIFTVWEWSLRSNNHSKKTALNLRLRYKSKAPVMGVESQADQTIKSLKNWIETGNPLK